MVKRPRWLVPAIGGVAVIGAAYAFVKAAAPASPVEGTTAAPVVPGGRAEPELPRIDLGRLDRPRPEQGIGKRDLFDFASPPPPPPTPEPPPAPVTEATPPPVTIPTLPPLPPLNIKYIGTLENKRGLKVAMFLTDKKEVLTGQVGEVVANRFRVVRIGLESVDIQEVGSEQTRRIALKGN